METYYTQAREISQNASVEYNRTIAEAEAYAMATTEKARIIGLKRLYNRIGMFDINQKNSLNYLRTISHLHNIHLGVDIETMVLFNEKGTKREQHDPV